MGLLSFALVGGLVAAGWKVFSVVKAPPTEIASLNYRDREEIEINLGANELVVEVVNTQASITQGLSGRPAIGADGMLFILPAPQMTSFWMKQMQFDLDLVWIKDEKVVSITADVPQPAADSNQTQLPTYPSPGIVDMILELPAGKAAELGIVTGANLEFK